MKAHSLIRTLYLYTFSLLGLVLIVIGMVRILDIGLKAFVFKEADEQERFWENQPPYPSRVIPSPDDVKVLLGDSEKKEINLTDAQKSAIQDWLVEYRDWKEKQEKFDPVTARRQREASSSIAFIIVGLPVFLYHWRTIRREMRG